MKQTSKKLLWLLLALFTAVHLRVNAQQSSLEDLSKLTDMLPPSPSASDLMRYSGASANLSSGSVNYSIPLLELSTGKLSTGVAIAYNSNGIKVDQIGSRVGIGWSLLAGGTISRVVYDDPDEMVNRIVAPYDLDTDYTKDGQFFEFIAKASTTEEDTQPDIFSFSFNGNSGEFVLDSNLKAIPIPHSNLKFESDFSGIDWNFTITDADGVKYYFGGSGATEQTKTRSLGAQCGKAYNEWVSTSWHLTKIVHPNGETLEFKYAFRSYDYLASASQTITKTPLGTRQTYIAGGNGAPDIWCPVIETDRACVSALSVNVAYLTEIKSSRVGKITLHYSTEREDLPGDVLLKSIELYGNSSSPIRRFELDHITYGVDWSRSNPAFSNRMNVTNDVTISKRTFLSALYEIDLGTIKAPASNRAKKYVFSYINPENMPPRLSTSQDDFGYYNGKENQNMIGRATAFYLQEYFNTENTGDRSPDFSYSKRGLLNKIVFPTGGYDSIVYEPHQFWAQEKVTPPSIPKGMTIESFEKPDPQDTSMEIHISEFQIVAVGAGCRTDNPEAVNDLHSKARLTVTDVTFVPSSLVIQRDIKIGESYNTHFNGVEGHTYQITITAYGDSVIGDASVTYYEAQSTINYYNKDVAGCRVAQVNSYDKENHLAFTKQFLYVSSLSENKSSGVFTRPEPRYFSEHYNKIFNPLTPEHDADNIDCYGEKCLYYTAHSNSLVNLSSYKGSHFTYGSVFESNGVNFEGGGKEYKFYVSNDQSARDFIGQSIPEAPASNFSWKSGYEYYHSVFKREGESLVKNSEQYSFYSEDSRVVSNLKGYLVKKSYEPPCSDAAGVPIYSSPDPYDGVYYSLVSRWLTLDSVVTYTYDHQGQNPVMTYRRYSYKDPASTLVASITSNESNGKETTVSYNYPTDLTTMTWTTQEQKNLISLLVNRHIFSVPVEISQYSGASLTDRVRQAFLDKNGLVLPATVKKWDSVLNAEYDAVTFIGYDNEGKLLSQRQTEGSPVSYLWGYSGLYPVAEVKNASHGTIFHTSFEETGTEGAGARTGRRYHTGAYTFTPPADFMPVASSTLSYWSWSAASGEWSLVEQPYSGGTVTCSGDRVDEVRIHPKEAQMTTYTHDPLVGVTSVTDPNGRTTYYEYDGFGRLKAVRDHGGNLLKTHEYRYAGQ